jgi:hypothetical protein
MFCLDGRGVLALAVAPIGPLESPYSVILSSAAVPRAVLEPNAFIPSRQHKVGHHLLDVFGWLCIIRKLDLYLIEHGVNPAADHTAFPVDHLHPGPTYNISLGWAGGAFSWLDGFWGSLNDSLRSNALWR